MKGDSMVTLNTLKKLNSTMNTTPATTCFR